MLININILHHIKPTVEPYPSIIQSVFSPEALEQIALGAESIGFQRMTL